MYAPSGPPAVGAPDTNFGYPGPPLGNEPDASTEQQPVAKIDLTVHLDSEKRDRLGRIICREWERYYQETQPRRANVERWRRDYELYPTGLSTRWPRSADVNAPLTHIYCQSHYTRLQQMITKSDPPFVCVARKPEVQPYAPAIEEACIACLEEAGWEEIASQVHAELPQVGNCLLRVTYEQRWIRSPRFQYDWDAELYQAALETGGDPLAAHFDAVKLNADGSPDIALNWVNQLQHSGVSLRLVVWEDCVILPATCRDPDEAYGIGERLMIRGSELAAGAKSGRYFADAVREVLEKHSEPQPADRAERLYVQGLTATDAASVGDLEGGYDSLYKEFECLELNWQMDTDGDGQMEWVIATVHRQSKKLLRLQHLPYQHGRPYYVMFRYHVRPRELFAMSVAEKLASLQAAATAVLCQIIDAADLILAIHGNFFYDGTSGFDPDKNPVQLGRPIKVDNVDGVKVIEIPQLPVSHYQVYQLIKDQADLITASSNPSLGKTTDTSKTLGEVQIVASASNMIFEEVALGVARTWAKVWDQVRWLNAQFGDDGIVQYRVSAAPSHQISANGGGQQGTGAGFAVIPAELLMEDVDLVPAGLKSLSDAQSRIQQATVVNNTFLTHPLTMNNPDVLKIGLDYLLQQLMFPPRERVMAAVEQQLQAEAAMAQMQQQLGLPPDGGAGGPGQPPQAAGPDNPGQQAHRGNPNQPPGSPEPPRPPQPPRALPEGATAQHGGP